MKRWEIIRGKHGYAYSLKFRLYGPSLAHALDLFRRQGEAFVSVLVEGPRQIQFFLLGWWCVVVQALLEACGD